MLTDIRNLVKSNGMPNRAVEDTGSSGKKSFELEAVENEDHFNQLEALLSTNSEFKKDLVEKLMTLGGKSLAETLKNMMRRLLTNQVLAKFNLRGKGNKRSMMSTETYKVLLACTMKRHANSTEVDVKDAMAIILKTAPDRPGGGGRKTTIGINI